MNTTRFFLNYAELVKILHKANFPQSELAQLAMQGALKLEELEMQERQVAIQEEQARQTLELQTIQAKIANKQAIAETIKSLMQTEAMQRSIKDNACINKSNAFVGYLNVMGNANDTAVAARYAGDVTRAINAIDTSALNVQYNQILQAVRDELQQFIDKNEGCKDVIIFTPRLELLTGERARVLGISSYGNNASRFFIDDIEQPSDNTKTLLFMQEQAGSYNVRFEAQDDKGTWVGDSLQIEVRDLHYKP